MAHQYCAFILKNKKPVHLIGHSMGGMIAMHMALINPKLFKSIHLCGTACDGRACLEKGELLNKAKNSDMSPLMRLLELCVSSTFLETEYGKLLQRRFLNPPILLSPKILRYQLNAIKQFDLKGELGQLQVPCFIYAGEKDRIVPIELSRRLVREIPGAALDIFSSGHLFFEESRNEFEQTLRNNVSCFL
jgi:pimeloyl-ACP methyl ester carboxylesterase